MAPSSIPASSAFRRTREPSSHLFWREHLATGWSFRLSHFVDHLFSNPNNPSEYVFCMSQYLPENLEHLWSVSYRYRRYGGIGCARLKDCTGPVGCEGLAGRKGCGKKRDRRQWLLQWDGFISSLRSCSRCKRFCGHLSTVVSIALHMPNNEVSGMRVRELTTVVLTIAKMTVIMTSEKIQNNAIFLGSLIWILHNMLIGINITKFCQPWSLDTGQRC